MGELSLPIDCLVMAVYDKEYVIFNRIQLKHPSTKNSLLIANRTHTRLIIQSFQKKLFRFGYQIFPKIFASLS